MQKTHFSSAGVGRTGTLISLDCLLEQAADEGVVDIFRCVYQMRKNRVNMIQTLVSGAHLQVVRVFLPACARGGGGRRLGSGSGTESMGGSGVSGPWSRGAVRSLVQFLPGPSRDGGARGWGQVHDHFGGSGVSGSWSSRTRVRSGGGGAGPWSGDGHFQGGPTSPSFDRMRDNCQT